MPRDDGPNQTAQPTSDIERLLCMGQDGALNDLHQAAADAWSMELPSLASFAQWPDSAPDLTIRPKICIATEQIAGPVRNGGIGNTYASLALMLAEAGFDVTALYLRGQMCETHDMDHWVADYAAKGVKLVPVPDYAAQEGLQTGADRWLHAPYNMMRWLIDHPMDVVHVSEWRGSSFLCLLAKRQGLAFANTLFLVKTSSPWMWNRLYGAHQIEKFDDLAKVQAERQSVELADVVIGGSLHLLRWMASQGYHLPRARAFVQPNVVAFTKLEPLMAGRLTAGGSRVPVDEFVFFGRLELRKGLFVFCQTIRRLIRKGVKLPPKITFMGKPGGRMPSHPDLEAPDYLRLVTADWPTKVEILTEFQQFDAVQYLLSGPRLAIMPSIIENSSMAVYEAAICGIPTVASDVGGNAELIMPEDHSAVLCQPHPVSLGDRLEEVLALGGYVPRPSFDNNANLETWRRFHRQLGGPLHEELLAQTRPKRPLDITPATSVCIYATGDAATLAQTLASLAAQSCAPHEVLIGIDAEDANAALAAAAMAAQAGVAARIIEAYDLDAGAAFDLMASEASGAYIHCLWEGATLRSDALATLQSAAHASGAQVLTYLHRVADGRPNPPLRGPVLGSPSVQFFRSDLRELPLFIERAAWLGLGGFTGDYRVIGHDHEWVMRAMAAGLRCETVMAELGSILERSGEWMRKAGYDTAACQIRALRPMLTAAPLALRDLLLFAKTAPAKSPSYPRWRDHEPAMRFAETFESKPAEREAAPMRPVPVDRIMTDQGHENTDGQTRKAGNICGRFLGIYQGRLFGWAIDLADPERVVEVELTVAGQTWQYPAKQRFPKWANVPPEALRNGFTIELPPAYHTDRAGTDLSLTVKDSTLVLAQGTAVPPKLPLERSGIIGVCEANDQGWLCGWAAHVDEPERFVELAAYIDGVFFARFMADLAHPKARQRTGQNGGGFKLEIPPALRSGGEARIDVVVAEMGIPLQRSPLILEGQRLRLTGWPALWRMGK